MSWQEIGSVFVDSGTIAVGDPCYTQSQDADHVAESWSEWCDSTPLYRDEDKGTLAYSVAEVMGQRGIGLVVSTLYGDGEYAVMGDITKDGRVRSIRIDFDEPDDDQF